MTEAKSASAIVHKIGGWLAEGQADPNAVAKFVSAPMRAGRGRQIGQLPGSGAWREGRAVYLGSAWSSRILRAASDQRETKLWKVLMSFPLTGSGVLLA